MPPPEYISSDRAQEPVRVVALDLGRHAPMGATVRDRGINFSVFSRHAERIELCLFDASGASEMQRLVLHGPHDGVFHGFLPESQPGLVYGLRAYGPYDPARGHRFNPHKVLLDPYAREIVGHLQWGTQHHGYQLGHPNGSSSLDTTDNGTSALKARVTVPTAYDRSCAPHTELGYLVLYEVNVQGFSQTHPGIPDALRGTYAALAHPTAISHFKALGVTTLSLLPVQYVLDEPALAERGLINYWGYNTLGFFCPSPRLSAHPQDPAAAAQEFRTMVKALHAHGLEVVLDVVYNHTAEGSEQGPTLSFRGLDNANWYRLLPDDRSRCENLTGCGNTLNADHPQVTQFILDSLRYWVEVMGVDGFRFDLAPVLGRTHGGFDPDSGFFRALRQDPVLNTVHLIAEPWDAAHDGYQVGRFPGRFMEWNDKFRDTVRSYWLQPFLGSQGIDRGAFARRFTGSSDLFHHGQRQPTASVNFITAHDGFTLHDMLSYQDKHNQANGEHNRDGREGEVSHNFGVEGPSDDPRVLALRQRVRRALMATLLLAQGTPMLCAGDEIGNSQGGNNNAYCQNNPTGWLNWEQQDSEFLSFVADVLKLRRAHALLRHTDWFVNNGDPNGQPALQWLKPDSCAMQTDDWHDRFAGAFACRIRGATQSLLIAFNPETQPMDFGLGGRFELLFDSAQVLRPNTIVVDRVSVPSSALVLLRQAD